MENENLLKREEALTLYERYGVLLPKGQRLYFEEYYVNDLSLSEIADNEGISRSAVHDALKKSVKKLEHYEELLHLAEKRSAALKALEKAKSGQEGALEELEGIIDGI